MHPRQFRAARAAIGLCIGTAAAWTVFGGSIDALAPLCGTAVLGLIIIATRADRYRLDAIDAALFFAVLPAVATIVAIVGAGAMTSAFAGLAVGVASLWFRRWLHPSRKDLLYSAAPARQRGPSRRVRPVRPPVRVKRLLKLLAVGIGALTFLFGGLWTVLIVMMAHETGATTVEHWLGPLGLTTAGMTLGSWGMWALGTRTTSKAKKRRSAPA